jgi:anaerobic carbon-monoxide dehydrogenase iron sulfur subunit
MMMQKMILVDAAKCTGCRACELVCSVKKEGKANPARARVHVVRFEEIVFEIPTFCQQCETAPCITSCPVHAIKRDAGTGVGKIDHDRCIGCKVCMVVCPFGAMGFDPVGRKVYKCDQCDGDPTCVKFCETQALQYVEASAVNMKKSRDSARKLSELLQKVAQAARP